MLFEKLEGLIMTTRRENDLVRMNVLKGIKTNFVNFEKEGKTLTDNDEVKILLKMKAQYEDSFEKFLEGGRNDLYEKEKVEYDILMEYVPKQPTDEDVANKTKEIVNNFIVTNGSISMKDMKTIMGEIHKVYPNAKGEIVSKVVREMSK